MSREEPVDCEESFEFGEANQVVVEVGDTSDHVHRTSRPVLVAERLDGARREQTRERERTLRANEGRRAEIPTHSCLIAQAICRAVTSHE